MSATNTQKKLFRVALLATVGNDQIPAHDCLAFSSQDATSQAEARHPGYEAVHVFEVQDAGYALVIYSPNEAALSDDGAGFWSQEDGWTTIHGASLFKLEEMSTLRLPLAVGDDAQWVLKEEALRTFREFEETAST